MCLQQIADGLAIAVELAGVSLADVVVVGLDTPGPASATGVLSALGSTNFVHADWAGFDIRGGLATKLGKPVMYLNDGNAAALWGHFSIFGSGGRATSISAIIGTGLGGGVITEGSVVKGRAGFGGELGHVLIPYQSISGIEGLIPQLQLRPYRRPGIAVLAHGDRADLFCRSFSPLFRPRTRQSQRLRVALPSRSVAWQNAAMRCAETYSGYRRMRSGCSSTR